MGLGPNLTLIEGSTPFTLGGAAAFGASGFVGTNDGDYFTTSFYAEISVTSTSGGTGYFGLGRGPSTPEPSENDNFGNPAAGLVALIRHYRTGPQNNVTVTTNDQNNGGLTLGNGFEEISNIAGVGPGVGTYLLAMSFGVGTKMLQFNLDGLPYGPGRIDLGAYDFGNEGRIFFGGDGFTFDNLNVQPFTSQVLVPAGMVLLIGALGGLGFVRSRRAKS